MISGPFLELADQRQKPSFAGCAWRRRLRNCAPPTPIATIPTSLQNRQHRRRAHQFSDQPPFRLFRFVVVELGRPASTVLRPPQIAGRDPPPEVEARQPTFAQSGPILRRRRGRNLPQIKCGASAQRNHPSTATREDRPAGAGRRYRASQPPSTASVCPCT